ncbi:MAG: hypothetical protein H0W22_09200 [Chloroflexi bacterium]|nr:hypothetical protein [Chloroflexota bacterium]
MGCATAPPSQPVAAPSAQATPASAEATGEPPSGGLESVSPSLPAIRPGEGRLVWLVSPPGGLGVWTTDLAGGEARAFITGLDEAGVALRDARLVGDDVVFIREGPATPTAELWVVAYGAPPRLLLDAVETFVASGRAEVLAVRDEGSTRAIWRVPTGGAPPAMIAEVSLPDAGAGLGPFGFAISPDGRTVAAGWVGGSVHVVGPSPAEFRDVGAPLVVADDGRLVAVTGRAGEAYLLDGDRLVELAPPDSDPVAVPGTGTVAWPIVGEGGDLLAVNVRDVLAGTSHTYQAGGRASNVRDVTATHVILEATAFDPLTRTAGIVDRRDGRFASFEASSPTID